MVTEKKAWATIILIKSDNTYLIFKENSATSAPRLNLNANYYYKQSKV